MKKHTMIAAAVAAVLFSATAIAQPVTNKHCCTSERAKVNYLIGARSDNEGLSESSLMETAKVKMLYPDANLQEIKSVADSLALNGSTPSLRYMAYLASNVLENPGWFGGKTAAGAETPDKFFASIATELQERVLGSRAN